MFWNKKNKGDKGRLPDLPAEPRAAPSMADYKHTPGLQEFDKLKRDGDEIRALPSFPDSPTKKDFTQSAIKEAVAPPTKEALPELPRGKEVLPELPRGKEVLPKLPTGPPLGRPKTIEMEEWKPKQPMQTLQTIPALPTMGNPVKKSTGTKQIFVKLEKFQSASNSLEIVKEKLDDIDELLRTIREVKMKEDQELSSWEKEIEAIKARINSVASEIFEGPQN